MFHGCVKVSKMGLTCRRIYCQRAECKCKIWALWFCKTVYHSRLFTPTFQFFTRIYPPYPWHFATLTVNCVDCSSSIHGSVGFAIDTTAWVILYNMEAVICYPRVFYTWNPQSNVPSLRPFFSKSTTKGKENYAANILFMRYPRKKHFNLKKVFISCTFPHSYFRSMAKALPLVKEMILKLVESRSKIPTWVLTSFNDPAVSLLKKTNKVKELRSGLSKLEYGGGGDLEEEAFQGRMLGIKTRFLKSIMVCGIYLWGSNIKRIDKKNMFRICHDWTL